MKGSFTLLVDALAQGDDEAVAAVYGRVIAELEGYSEDLVKDQEVHPMGADDVASEAFARMIDYLRSDVGGNHNRDDFKKHLRHISWHVAKDANIANQTLKRNPEAQGRETPVRQEAVTELPMIEFKEALDSLPPQQRELALMIAEGHSAEEMAARLMTSRRTIQRLCHALLLKIRRMAHE